MPSPTPSLRVFLSSTLRDLTPERSAVERAIHRMNERYIGMEHFGSFAERPLSRCLDEVRGSQAMVLVLGEAYGSTPPGSDASFTEHEYRAARAAGIPVHAYLLAEETMAARSAMDPRLVRLRAEVRRDLGTSLFATPDGLAWQVVADLHRAFPGAHKAGAGAPARDVVLAPEVLPEVWNIQPRNPHFTGRDAVLARLGRALAGGRPAAIVQTLAGLGGVGKTQLAREYAWTAASQLDVVWWVRAEDAGTRVADLAELGVALGVAEAFGNQALAAKAARKWLEHSDRWLVIFDNATSHAEVADDLPGARAGQILVTSRDAAWGAAGQTVRLDVFEPDEARRFLEGWTGQTDGAADLAEALGLLPLALAQAAAYVGQTGQSLRGYLALFREREADLLARGKAAPDYPATVAVTWELNFRKVEAERPAAADLLRLLAFVAPERVPLDLLAKHAKGLPEPLASALADPIKRLDLRAELGRYSLVDGPIEALSSHRLVQVVTRSRMKPETRKLWASAAAELLRRVFRFEWNGLSTWEESERLFAHAVAAAEAAQAEAVALEAAWKLLHLAGTYANRRGDLARARELLEATVRLLGAHRGEEEHGLAVSLHALATVLRAQGDLAGAREHLERCLQKWAKVFGTEEHTSVAASLHVLAMVLRDQGDLAGAREHLERSLRTQARVFGTEEHPDVATSLHELASVLRDQGDLAGAREHLERSLRFKAKVFGTEEHPSVAASLHVLASVLRDQGDLAGAREHLERSLRIKAKVFGTEEHFETAIAELTLAIVLLDLGEPERARDLARHAHGVLLSVLGPEHPATQLAAETLALGMARS